MELTKFIIHQFQNEILEWYRKNKRDLPWRHTRDPYNILLSEVMSQQTQIAREGTQRVREESIKTLDHVRNILGFTY